MIDKTPAHTEKIVMHPAVRAHISGNLNIIRTCMSQIEAAMNAEELGYQSAAEIGAVRIDKEKAGNETPFLDAEGEKMLTQGLAEMFQQSMGEVNETQPDETRE